MSPTAAKPRGLRVAAPLAAVLLIALLAAITLSGHWPQLQQMVPFTSKGLVAIPSSDITRVEIRTGQDVVSLRRDAGGWTIDGVTGAVPAELASHVDAGLRLVHVSEPAREMAANELTPGSFAEFGLDPPASVVALSTASGAVATLNFGVLNPASTSQYVRLGGAPTVYLMGRHVGAEWQVAGDMARRLRGQAEPAVASRGTSLFLPVSMASGMGGRDRGRRQTHTLRARWRRQLVSPCRAAFALRQQQRPRRRSGTGRPDRYRARSIRCDRDRSPHRARRRRATGATRPELSSRHRAALCTRQLAGFGASSNSAAPPTASIAMRGWRRTAMS